MKQDTAHRIRVLIADDSATAREFLTRLLETGGFEVVGAAQDGVEVVTLAAQLRPDVITMDILMPRLDGIIATRQIMADTPTPIVVVSASVDETGGGPVFEAMSAGALSVIAKPPGPGHPRHEILSQELLRVVRLMADVKVVRRWSADRSQNGDASQQGIPSRPQTNGTAWGRGNYLRPELIAIAASTGGPQALQHILRALGPDIGVPVLIVQHISAGFATGMAAWLTSTCLLPTRLPVQGETPQAGTVYLAPEDVHLIVTRAGTLTLSKAPPANGFRPSADVLFTSVAEHLGARALGIILTGMGDDGAVGLAALHALGAPTIAQDEATSVVYGMPRAAIVAGAASRVLALPSIAPAVRELLGLERIPAPIIRTRKPQ